ncbi:MAG: acetyltransferase [Bacteroidota bacterium]
MTPKSEKKMVLFGHSDGGVPIVMDLANEIFDCKQFIIVKNVKLPDNPFPSDHYKAIFIEDTGFDATILEDCYLQFGTHNSHVKYAVFSHFFSRFHVGKKRYTQIIHASSYISKSATIGEGTMVEPMCVVSSMATLGDAVTIKRSASIGHHCNLGDFVNINPGAVLSGYVNVGFGTEIGSGTVISNNVSIGEKCLIGAGSVVTKDIPDGVVAFGNPCRVVRPNERWDKIIG